MEKDVIDKFYSLLINFKKTMIKNNVLSALSHAEFSMLYLIGNCQNKMKDITTAELSRRSLITKSAVSQMINVLEEKKYVKRKIHKDDRRLSCVTITEAGQKNLEEYTDKFLDILDNVFDKMGENDSVVFINLLEKYLSLLAESANENANS